MCKLKTKNEKTKMSILKKRMRVREYNL
jgi:hypothetical protein